MRRFPKFRSQSNEKITIRNANALKNAHKEHNKTCKKFTRRDGKMVRYALNPLHYINRFHKQCVSFLMTQTV